MEEALEQPLGYACLTFPQKPESLFHAQRTYAEASSSCSNTNFLKGVKWSPDGACLLTASDDDWLRVYDLPAGALQHQPEKPTDIQPSALQRNDMECTAAAKQLLDDSLTPALVCHGGETVYDYAWYPRMIASEPVSCCFASTSRAHPIHLWDACTGGIRCSYRAYDEADEVTAAYSLGFSLDGGQLYAGFNKCIRIFDVTRPGRDYRQVVTQKRGQQGSIPGIISSIGSSPGNGDLVALGAYSGVVGIMDARTDEVMLVLRGHAGGVTQVMFSLDGNFLYTGARQDGQLLCWDVRCTGEALYALQRDTAATNQRIGFDIEPCGRHLATGGCNGHVQVFDLRDGSQVDSFQVAPDTVNGCAFCPVLPLLATASGHRRYALEPSSSDDEEAGDLHIMRRASQAAADRRYNGTCVAMDSDPADSSRERASSAWPSLPPFSNSLRMWRMAMEWVEVDAGAGAVQQEHQQAGVAAAAGQPVLQQQPGTGAELVVAAALVEAVTVDPCAHLPEVQCT